MNGDFFTNAAQPTAEEFVPGGSYLPTVEKPADFKLQIGGQTQGQRQTQAAPAQAAPPMHQYTDLMQKSAKGKASDVNDFGLTISGIADGDPVGMETFDLGFFDDGTPAIVINGANVPIRHDQWMALMTMRNKTRDEVKARAEFESAKMTAMDAITKVEMATRLPNGMIPLIKAQAQFDPPGAIESLQKIYLSVQTTGGKDLMGEVSRKLQEFKNSTVIDHMTKPQGETIVKKPHPYLQGQFIDEAVKQPSRRDQRVQEFSRSAKESDQITGFAYQRLEDFMLDPTLRQINPQRSYGIFDRIQEMEADRYGPMSLFSRLQHIAAFNKDGDWPGNSRVAIQPPPAITDQYSNLPEFMQMTGLSDAEQRRYLEYLAELDMWAANAFGYDRSSLESLAMTAQQMGAINMQRMGMAAAQQGTAARQAAPRETTTSQAVTPSGRPRATRSTTTG